MLAPRLGRPSAPPSSVSMPSLPTIHNRYSPVRRRTTLKRSIDETDHMSIPSSPSKRSRVTFDSEVETFSAEEDDLDPLVVKEEVRRAIQRHLVGDDELYEKFRSIFRAPANQNNAPSTKTLQIYLQAMLSNVSSLSKSCHVLVHSVVFSEWIGRNETYYNLFAKFLSNLAAAQSGYMNKISQMLIDLLGPQKTRRISGAQPVRQPLIHRRAIQVLQYIGQKLPNASVSFAEAISKRMEWEFSKPEDRIIFIKSFMVVVDYVPELASNVLTSVMAELVKLDVSVQADLDEEDDDAEEEILQHMSSSQTLVATAVQLSVTRVDDDDFNDGSTTDESDEEDQEEYDSVETQRRRLKANIHQVDLILDILFRYYTKSMSSTTIQTRDNAIAQLTAHFQKLILPTYRSRHPQFLIFHFAQSSPILVDQFVSECIKVLIDKKQPQILRQSAAAYFSGFVGRGAHVSPAVVSDCVGLLCDQLNILRKAYEPSCRGPDLKRYSDFYATMQAIMYIFCFRWRDLASTSSDVEDDESDIDEDQVEQYHFQDVLRNALSSAIYSPLNPLRICTPIIVEQFANLTFALQFLYLHSKIETNKHVRLHGHWRSISDMTISSTERDTSWVGDSGMMEGYFPYDPYHLPISKHWLDGDYVEWRGIPGEDQEESGSENEDGMVVQDDNEEEHTATEEE